MKQRLALKGADRHAQSWAACEHEDGARGGMYSENGEHAALIVVAEMEEAVPGEDAIENRSKRQ